MPRVVPSDVVSFIDSVWPNSQNNDISKNEDTPIAGLLDLTDQLPDELLVLDSTAYAEFICAKAHIRQRLSAWANNPDGPGWLGQMRGMPNRWPVAVIRKALKDCPNSHPAPDTAELNFIQDTNLRAALRIDLAEANRALSNSEFKAATVLAGSAAEALLLWALRQRQTADINLAITTARASGMMNANPDPNDLDQWNLHQCIEVSAELGIIKPNTAKQARLAKDFRNFIHPGVAQRLGEKCDRATALSAVAGMEHVIRDLTP